MAMIGCIFHDAAKQLPFERVDADVIVRNLSRVDQAADHETSTAEPPPGFLLLANECSNRPATKGFDCGNQCIEPRPRLSRRSRSSVVGLAGIRV